MPPITLRIKVTSQEIARLRDLVFFNSKNRRRYDEVVATLNENMHSDSSMFDLEFMNEDMVFDLFNLPEREVDMRDCLKYAIHTQDKINQTDCLGNSVLHYAAQVADKSLYDFILGLAPKEIDLKNNQGQTPLVRMIDAAIITSAYEEDIVKKNVEDIAINLIDNGADVRAVDSEGRSAESLIRNCEHFPRIKDRIKKAVTNSNDEVPDRAVRRARVEGRDTDFGREFLN